MDDFVVPLGVGSWTFTCPTPVQLWNKFGGRNILSSHEVTTKLMRIWEIEIVTITTWQ